MLPNQDVRSNTPNMTNRPYTHSVTQRHKRRLTSSADPVCMCRWCGCQRVRIRTCGSHGWRTGIRLTSLGRFWASCTRLVSGDDDNALSLSVSHCWKSWDSRDAMMAAKFPRPRCVHAKVESGQFAVHPRAASRQAVYRPTLAAGCWQLAAGTSHVTGGECRLFRRGGLCMRAN